MAAVVVLISHDHHVAVPERVEVLVLLARVETEDVANGLDLGVLTDGLLGSIADIQELASKRESSVHVLANDLDSSHSKGLSRVSFSEDDGAVFARFASGQVGVIELRHVDFVLFPAF